jgi:hypothetical protein
MRHDTPQDDTIPTETVVVSMPLKAHILLLAVANTVVKPIEEYEGF